MHLADKAETSSVRWIYGHMVPAYMFQNVHKDTILGLCSDCVSLSRAYWLQANNQLVGQLFPSFTVKIHVLSRQLHPDMNTKQSLCLYKERRQLEMALQKDPRMPGFGHKKGQMHLPLFMYLSAIAPMLWTKTLAAPGAKTYGVRLAIWPSKMRCFH